LGQPNAIVRRLPQEMCGMIQGREEDDDADLHENRKCFGHCRETKRKTALCGSLIMTRPYPFSLGIQRYWYWPDGTYQVDYTEGQEVLGFIGLVRRSGAGVLTVNLQLTTLEAFLTTFQLFPLADFSRQVLFAYGLTRESQPPANWHTMMEPASMPLGHPFHFDADGVLQEAENEELDFYNDLLLS
jgi:hypothetical protein